MNTMMSVRVDHGVKVKAQKFAASFGVPLSTIINACLRDFIKTKRIVLSLTPTMSPSLERTIGRAVRDYQQGKRVSPAFDTAKDAIRYLRGK